MFLQKQAIWFLWIETKKSYQLTVWNYSHGAIYSLVCRGGRTSFICFRFSNARQLLLSFSCAIGITNSSSAPIALFTVNSAHLHYNKILHVCEAISGYFVVSARNCLASTLDYIVMQMRKINLEKGYCLISRSWLVKEGMWLVHAASGPQPEYFAFALLIK